MGKGRRIESNVEEMRKSVGANLNKASQVVNARQFGRLVDRDALIKCRVKEFAQWNNGVFRPMQKSANAEMYESYRNHYANGFHTAEIPLGMSLEELYYDKYSEGFDGTDVPPRIGEHYVCKCGMKFAMSITALPYECSWCKKPTPKGRLFYDGYIKQ